jgi:hypothetical protein
MEIKVEPYEFDKNYHEDEYCKGCCGEFMGFDNCIKFTSINGEESFMCLDCYKEYKKSINSIKIWKFVNGGMI